MREGKYFSKIKNSRQGSVRVKEHPDSGIILGGTGQLLHSSLFFLVCPEVTGWNFT